MKKNVMSARENVVLKIAFIKKPSHKSYACVIIKVKIVFHAKQTHSISVF